jgi:hypothetical protein
LGLALPLEFSRSFVFMNFSGYSVKERIEEIDFLSPFVTKPLTPPFLYTFARECRFGRDKGHGCEIEKRVPAQRHSPRPDRGPSMKFLSSFVFINFSGYPCKERIEEPEVRIGAPPAAAGFGRRPPPVFLGIGCEKFFHSFVFINIAGCTFIFESRS